MNNSDSLDDKAQGGAMMNPESKLNSEVAENTGAGAANPFGNSAEPSLINLRDSRASEIEISDASTKVDTNASSRSLVRRATGPRTASGKEKSKRNALKLGIFANGALLPDESRVAFNSLWRGLRKILEPVGVLEEALSEKMAVNLWSQRRLINAEVAGIEEIHRGYAFRKDDDHPKEVSLRVVFRGQEDHSALMETTPLPARDRCLQLLRELVTGVRSSGFDSNRDTVIFTKLYGNADQKRMLVDSYADQKRMLVDSYQTWQLAANGSQEELLQKGLTSPQECVEHFVKDVESEIRRLESEKVVDRHKLQLRRLRQTVPDCEESDHLLRRMTTLERSFDRLLTQFERCRRIRLGRPLPPQIEVHHSISRE